MPTKARAAMSGTVQICYSSQYNTTDPREAGKNF